MGEKFARPATHGDEGEGERGESGVILLCLSAVILDFITTVWRLPSVNLQGNHTRERERGGSQGESGREKEREQSKATFPK